METLARLSLAYGTEAVEGALVRHYVQASGLTPPHASLFSRLLPQSSTPPALQKAVDDLGHITLAALAAHMECLIPEQDRQLNGAYFTPPYIVAHILRTVHPDPEARVLDPACGSGAFLLGAVRFLRETYGLSIRESLRHIEGADILPYNLRRAALLLCLLAALHGETLTEGHLHLTQCDSLTRHWTATYDVIVGNPPYVKFQDLGSEQRDRLSQRWQTTSKGNYNLHFAFFELGESLLSPGGRLGYIAPNNVFTSLAAEPLRRHFAQRRALWRIVDFAQARVFEAQTYTALFFASAQEHSSIEYARLPQGSSPQEFLSNTTYTSNPYTALRSGKWHLLCGAERDTVPKLESVGVPLGALTDICASIATLRDDVYSFVATDDDDEVYRFERRGRVWAVEKDVTRSVVKIPEMRSEKDLPSNSRRIIFPYRLQSGRALVLAESELSERYPLCYNYLLSQRDELDARDKGLRPQTPFYAYGRSQSLAKSGAHLLTPTFARKPRFMLHHDPQALFTNGYGLYETCHRDLLSPPLGRAENFDVLARLLNTPFLSYYIAATSVRIQGGYPCYQKNFIERYCVPQATEADVSWLRGAANEEVELWLGERYGVKVEDVKPPE